ncbi:DNA ligase (ATP) [Pseudoalteromonas citrea]|uniref:DNA ligase (ATP) n=2 Tax=Pseudoalteromonas citrea TaxID=43655 RepID=A0AAD4AMA9_9GAMM|nr:DNA ligase [Pseudoalteromonas citrea]KAF7775370.1 DNA ligase (ATP) [Pseudoalteromonas citrea]
MSIRWILWATFVFSLMNVAVAETASYSAQLAKRYQAELPVSFYHVSEKYDGVRAIWDGKQLKTRTGNVIHAPTWFIENLPKKWLDGELWAGYNNFAYVSSLARRRVPNSKNWQQVSYMVFDAPDSTQPFSQRYLQYDHILKTTDLAHVKPVIQHRFENPRQLERFFNNVVKKGGEGVMLHLSSAKHTGGRTKNLLKYKPYQDAEAKVIAHLPGKGRYIGKTGALLVKSESGIEFKIGSGLSDKERDSPPEIGSIVSFRHQGFTKYGKPRFAVFLRPKATF